MRCRRSWPFSWSPPVFCQGIPGKNGVFWKSDSLEGVLWPLKSSWASWSFLNRIAQVFWIWPDIHWFNYSILVDRFSQIHVSIPVNPSSLVACGYPLFHNPSGHICYGDVWPAIVKLLSVPVIRELHQEGQTPGYLWGLRKCRSWPDGSHRPMWWSNRFRPGCPG